MGGDEKGWRWEGEKEEWEIGGEGKEGKGGDPYHGLVDTPMFEILKKYPDHIKCRKSVGAKTRSRTFQHAP